MHESGVPFCGRPLLIFHSPTETQSFDSCIYTSTSSLSSSSIMQSGKWQSCSFPPPTEWVKGNVIGSGSFGTVNLAVDTATGSLFVVKSARSEAGVASLKHEAEILRNLNSPHIVRCMGAANRSLFFEYMCGGSISDVMQKFGGALQEKVIRLYTRQILEGLRYLHDNGIVHSDIKCKNLLLGASGTVKITDFGCARRPSASARSCIGGTPLWMAPEVLRHEAVDFSADIWSLGCTVIEMASGRPPWGGDASNPMAALLEIARGDDLPEFPKHLSAEGVDFLRRCLEREAGKRWTSEMLLDHPFVSSRTNDPALSPTSVLDVASNYDSDDLSDDGGDDDEDEEFVGRVPFSMKLGLQEKKLMLQSRNALENHSEASDGWITVRSR